MAETGKRLEVRYGGFACRIEGYDDPVEKMRGVLAAMQQAIADNPALIDAASRLESGQFDRIRAALADGGAELDAATPGLVVIRNAEDDTAAGRAEAGGAAEQADGDALTEQAGPHPTAGTFAAPAAAAAAAEAAFAAEIAAEDEVPPDEAPLDEPSQGPLVAEEPGRPATSAATFAAPAAELAAAQRRPGAGTASFADPDEDAGEARRVPADEAAEDEAAEDEAAEDGAMAPFEHPEDVPDRWSWPAGEPDARDREAGFVNIFAPPPPQDVGHRPTAADAAEMVVPASLRREPGPAAADRVVPDWSERVPGEWRDEHAVVEHDAGRPDEALDDEHDPEDEFDATAADASGSGSVPTAENRFAALITRYQDARQRVGATEPAQAGPQTDVSATELAERAGAEDVADLLAASAAWLTLAAGRPRFTRREVMEVFETIPGDHPRTLEARIKGFGKLVRSGALVLVNEGTFAMSQPARDDFRALIDQR